jgi:hypothetical protein
MQIRQTLNDLALLRSHFINKYFARLQDQQPKEARHLNMLEQHACSGVHMH